MPAKISKKKKSARVAREERSVEERSSAEEVVLADSEHHFVKKNLPLVKKNLSQSQDAEEKVSQQLLAIYENTDGTLPDMKTFEKRERSGLAAHLLWCLAAVIFVSAAAMIWQSFFGSSPSLAEADIALSMSGPETAVIGQEVTYRVRYHSDDKVALSKTSLEMLYPQGFVFVTSSLPAVNNGGAKWGLGELAAKASGYMDITGRLYGNLDETQTFSLLLSYTPSNFNSEFQKTATFSVVLNKSPVELVIASNEQAAVGDEVNLEMKVNRLDDLNWPMILVFEPGPAYVKKQSTPESDANDPYHWSLSGEAKSFSVDLSGSFGGEASGTIVSSTVKIISHVPGKPEAPTFVVTSQAIPTRVVVAPLTARLVVNGVSDNGAVAPGDLLSANILIKNNSDKALRHARVRFLLDAPSANNKSLLNWNKLEESRGGLAVGEQLDTATRRGTLTWTEKEVPELSEIAPGQELVFELNMPLKNGRETSLVNYTTHKITVGVDVTYDGVGAPEIRRGNTVLLALNSDLSLDIFDDVKIGSDLETHKITWSLNNSFHELKNIVASADFFGDVAWDESVLTVPAGTVVFDAITKKLTWRIDTLATETDVLALQFAIALKQKNPTQTALASKVRLSAHDTVTGQEIQLTGDEILFEE